MQRPSPAALSAVLLAVLVPLFYPALVLHRRLAPETALHSMVPWRSLAGPYPLSSPLIVEAASSLGPRLAAIARDPAGAALWNPWIGGGRGGWLASAREGGTPTVLAAALFARPQWRWTALVALTIALAMTGAYWVMRLLRFPTPAAVVGATSYALSGASSSAWLTPDGGAIALGPFLLVPLLASSWSTTRRVGVAASVLALLLYCGSQAGQFVALAVALLIAGVVVSPRPNRRWAWLSVVALAALAALAPRLWLHAAAAEPDAPVVAPATQPAPGLRSMVVPFPLGDPVSSSLAPSPPTAATLRAAQAGFIGAAVLLLAALGSLSPFPRGGRALWLGLTATAALLVHLAPAGEGGIPSRPFGALALGVAVLAAAGTHLLTQQVPSAVMRGWLGAAVVGAVLLRLLPVAAHGLPFVPPAVATLENPVATDPHKGQPGRLVAFGATLPPDTAAIFAVPDLRAADLAGEPRFAAALRPRGDGTVPFDRVLDPVLDRLSGRLLVEPAQLHIISAELFSRTVASVGRQVHSEEGGEALVTIEVPGGATRIAVPTGIAAPQEVLLRVGKRSRPLPADAALAQESDPWRWFALPQDTSAGEATLIVRPPIAIPATPTLLWDTSGLLLVGERAGARTWLATRARPLAFVARAFVPEGGPIPDDPLTVALPAGRVSILSQTVPPGKARVYVTRAAATRVCVQVQSEFPGLLVIMVKHRPTLWKARLNGVAVATEPVDGLWTGLEVPPGTTYAELQARLPPWVLLTAAAGALAMAGCGLAGWRSPAGHRRGEHRP